MMNLIEILKAYKIFWSHGLEIEALSTLVSKTLGTGQNEKKDNVLDGNWESTKLPREDI